MRASTAWAAAADTDTDTVTGTDMATGTATAPRPHGDRPLISLVMTVRNGARYLAQALESVRAQTFSDWELVLWDDGSTDDTPAIARSFAADEPRIRLFSSAPIGRRRALVEAHRQAR